MRKRVIDQETKANRSDDQGWLDLESLAQVELTSEDAEHPIESALAIPAGDGWRALHAGKQTIRLRFDEPCRIKRIHLVFEESDRARTQEFLLRWSPDERGSWQEIVRQQYNFSPPDVAREEEDYVVNLDGLRLLELSIIPDISGGDACASLARLRLA